MAWGGPAGSRVLSRRGGVGQRRGGGGSALQKQQQSKRALGTETRGSQGRVRRGSRAGGCLDCSLSPLHPSLLFLSLSSSLAKGTCQASLLLCQSPMSILLGPSRFPQRGCCCCTFKRREGPLLPLEKPGREFTASYGALHLLLQ